jgi:superoxide dismutase, Cu-Zn family
MRYQQMSSFYPAKFLRLMVLGLVSLIGSLIVILQANIGFSADSQITVPLTGPGVTGTAVFTEDQSKQLVEIQVDVQGKPEVLTPGAHGLHLHEVGTCEAQATPAFGTAKGHHDPGPNGNTTPVEANHPYHLGDLPNLVINANGQGKTKIITSRISLSPGPISILDADSSALILHKNTDLYKASGTGAEAGGPRLACGVLPKRA